jgi:hypothetical protein
MKLFADVKQTAAAIERLIDRGMAAIAHARRPAPHPLEIHHAIVDEIEAQATAGPGGSHLFPYDHVTVELLATDGRAAALQAMFDRAGGLQQEIRKRLAQRDCEMPRDLTCAVRLVGATTAEWRADATYRLTFRRVGHDEREITRAPAADLVLALPTGEPGPAYRLLHGRTNVGRAPEVRDDHGHLIRRNLVCISAEHDPGATVSRCHAHVDAALGTGRPVACTVYDDASRYGTRVVREGRTIVVHPGTVGVRLRDGDELCFGAARAVFRIPTA